MGTHFFPDNTVLINFTIIDRQDLLTWFVRGKGVWTLSIARECERSAREPGLAAMNRWSTVLGAPLAPTPAEMVDAHAIADRMRGPGDNAPGQHMGEAEAIAVIVRRQIEAVFLTDDHSAARAAASEPLISTASTTKVLAFAEAAGRLQHPEARHCLADLLNAGRVMGNPPLIAAYDAYVVGLQRQMAQ